MKAKEIKGKIQFKILNIVIEYIAIGKELKFSLPANKLQFSWRSEHHLYLNVKVTKKIAEDYINRHYAILNTNIETQIPNLQIIRGRYDNSVHSLWINGNLFYFALSRPQYWIRGNGYLGSIISVNSLSRIKECYKSYLDFVNHKDVLTQKFYKLGLSQSEINKIFKYEYRQLKHCKMIDVERKDVFESHQKYCSLFNDFHISKRRELFYESLGILV